MSIQAQVLLTMTIQNHHFIFISTQLLTQFDSRWTHSLLADFSLAILCIPGVCKGSSNKFGRKKSLRARHIKFSDNIIDRQIQWCTKLQVTYFKSSCGILAGKILKIWIKIKTNSLIITLESVANTYRDRGMASPTGCLLSTAIEVFIRDAIVFSAVYTQRTLNTAIMLLSKQVGDAIPQSRYLVGSELNKLSSTLCICNHIKLKLLLTSCAFIVDDLSWLLLALLWTFSGDRPIFQLWNKEQSMTMQFQPVSLKKYQRSEWFNISNV